MRSLLIWLLIFPFFGIAQNREALEQIKLHAQQISTIQADFVQKKNISFIDEQLVSYGKFWFRKPDRMRWEYQKPFYYSIIINGDDITVIDDKKENHFNAGSNAMFGQVKLVIMNMVNGKMFDDPDYHATIKEEENYFVINFKTVNPAMKDYISSIDLYFVKKGYLMEKIKMNEASGDFTIIEFKNQVINQTIKTNVFDNKK